MDNGYGVQAIRMNFHVLSTAISSSLFFITLKLESIYKNDIIPNGEENVEKNRRGSQYTMVTYLEYKGNGSASRLVEAVIQNSLRRPLNVGRSLWLKV